MKALFYKDVIALKKNFIAFFILILFGFISIISDYVDMAYLISSFWLVDFFIKTYETEYKNNFYKYVISNAVDEKIIVIYKYLLIFSAVILAFLINFLITFFTGYDKNIYRFLLFSSINILLYEILIPIFFRFGKISRDVIKVAVAVIYILGIYYIVKNDTLLKFEIVRNLNVFIILITIDLILFTFSFMLSLKFIRRKIS